MNDKGICVILIAATFALFGFTDYKRVFVNSVSGLKIIYRYGLSYDQKMEIRCGADYSFVKYIRDNTELDATILMAGNGSLFPEGVNSPFARDGGGVRNKAWSFYFLYPRTLIYFGREDYNPKEIDYEIIVNGYLKDDPVEAPLGLPDFGIVKVNQ